MRFGVRIQVEPAIFLTIRRLGASIVPSTQKLTRNISFVLAAVHAQSHGVPIGDLNTPARTKSLMFQARCSSTRPFIQVPSDALLATAQIFRNAVCRGSEFGPKASDTNASDRPQSWLNSVPSCIILLRSLASSGLSLDSQIISAAAMRRWNKTLRSPQSLSPKTL